MRKYFPVITLIFIAVMHLHGFAQQEEYIYKEFNVSSWGFKAGPMAVILREGTENETVSDGYPVSYELPSDAGIKAGLGFGLFYETLLTGRLYLQIEANYQWYAQAVTYVKHIEYDYNTTQYADFDIKNSSILIPLLPKYRFGNRVKYYLMAGPYLNVPFSSNLSGEILVEQEEAAGKITTYVITGDAINVKPEKVEFGFMGGIGAKIPLKKDALVVEFRGGGSVNDVLKDPNFKSATIGLYFGVIKALK